MPLAIALSMSGAVVGARSNCLPSVPGKFAICVKRVIVTSRPFFSKMPSSFAIIAGSHVITPV